jgi:O-antigen/teichoic acid export membrane protein
MSSVENIPREDQATPQGRGFVVNVVWNWIGVVAGLATGLLLSPYLIRKLGPDGYGVWSLSFALVEYYWFFDLGVRSANVKYVAHYWAKGDRVKVGEVISTAVVYACLLSLFILIVVCASLKIIVSFFKVPPSYHDSFAVLILLITANWCIGAVFGLFGVSLDAVQRFDVTTKIGIASTALRAVGTVVLLYLGYGLIPIGIMVISSQLLTYGLNYIFFRGVFQNVRVSPRAASVPMLKQLGKFGIHSFLITFSTQLQNQSAPVLIGHFLPTAFAGYFNLPMRLIQYTVEFVGRIGIVTNSKAAELSAKEDAGRLAQLAIHTNRYCLAIFMPVALLLWSLGPRFLTLWVGPAMAAFSAQVLPILVLGYVLAVAGQFSAGMMMLGMGKHQRYARALVIETVLSLIFLTLVIPRYGIVGAAWVLAILMIAMRGIYTSYIASETVGMPMLSYVQRIYLWPILTAIPVGGLSWLLRATILPGANWLQIGLHGVILAVAYYLIAVFTCTDSEHRQLLFHTVSNRVRRLLPS